MKKLFVSALVCLVFVTSLVFAEFDNNKSEYRAVVYDESKFEATRNEDRSVSMSWSAFSERGNEQFQYYKIMKSYSNPNPVYPEHNAMAYIDNVKNTYYTDEWAEKSAYYRVCVITDQKGRYCSNVVWIEQGEDQRKEINDKIKEESHNQEVRHEQTWDKHKAEMEEKQKRAQEAHRMSERKTDQNFEEKPLEKEKNMIENKYSHSDMSERMEKAFTKVKPRLDKFLDRIESKLIESSKYSNDQKIKKIKKIQERLSIWEDGHEFKMILVDYLDKHFMDWIRKMENDLGLDDMDSLLDGIFED